MTLLEKRSLGALIASGLIFVWFQQRMLDGWRVADQSAESVLWVVIVVIVATIVSYAAIEGALAATHQEVAHADERDAVIEARATRNELFALTMMANVMVFQVLLQEAYGGGPFAPVAFGHAPTLVFGLFAALWIGEFVRLISILVYSRT